MSTVTSSAEPGAKPSVSGPGGLSRGRAVRNQLATVYVWAAFVLALVPLAWILWTVLSRGYSLLLDQSWWLNSQRGITPRRVGGGAYHAIFGTVAQAAVCAVIAVPIAVFTAISPAGNA